MVFNITSFENRVTSKEIENMFRNRSKTYLDLIRFDNSAEYRRLDSYFKNNYNTSLYDLMIQTLNYCTINKYRDKYLLTILNHSLVNNLNTDSFIKILLSGSLSIKKTYLVQNMVKYAFWHM